MRINSLYISAFGGIKDLRLELKDGFNIIYGENENGKSTVMAFIKMMLYGSERGSSLISKNVRKKYTPWDGSAMGGSIDFEHSGREYRLEREFKASNSTDRVVLYDLTLGERTVAPPDVGMKFLGLSASAFERSAFIGQFGYPDADSAAEGEINSKLSNIALTGDESVSFEKVNSRIESARLALMSKSGRAGEYDKGLRLCRELKERADKATELQEECRLKRERVNALREECKRLAVASEELKAKIAAEGDIRSRERLEEYLRLKERLDRLNESLRLSDGTLADEMFLRKIQFCLSKLSTVNAKTEAKQAEADRLKKSLAELEGTTEQENTARIAELQRAIEQRQDLLQKNEARISELKTVIRENEQRLEKKKGGSGVLLSLLATVLFIVAVLCGVFSLYILCAVAALAGAAAVVGLVSVKRADKKSRTEAMTLKHDTEEQLTALEEKQALTVAEADEYKQRLQILSGALAGNGAAVENQQKMLNSALSELEALEISQAEEKAALFGLFKKFRSAESIAEIEGSLDEISALALKQRELKQQLSYISKDLGNISYEQAEMKLKEISQQSEALLDTDFEAAKAEYNSTLAKIKQNDSEIAALEAEIRVSTANAENPDELKKRLSELVEKTAAQKEFCDAADIAMQTLLESFAEVRKSYGSVLEKQAGEIFSRLTGNRYDSMSISRTFDINVSQAEAFGSRELAYLSNGAADQAYLSLRLALSCLIGAEGEKIPVLLDDTLSQYDDRRMAAAVEFLSEFSKENQVIMFTCHNYVLRLAENAGAKVINTIR